EPGIGVLAQARVGGARVAVVAVRGRRAGRAAGQRRMRAAERRVAGVGGARVAVVAAGRRARLAAGGAAARLDAVAEDAVVAERVAALVHLAVAVVVHPVAHLGRARDREDGRGARRDRIGGGGGDDRGVPGAGERSRPAHVHGERGADGERGHADGGWIGRDHGRGDARVVGRGGDLGARDEGRQPGGGHDDAPRGERTAVPYRERVAERRLGVGWRRGGRDEGRRLAEEQRVGLVGEDRREGEVVGGVVLPHLDVVVALAVQAELVLVLERVPGGHLDEHRPVRVSDEPARAEGGQLHAV